jgi:hypothetical protein
VERLTSTPSVLRSVKPRHPHVRRPGRTLGRVQDGLNPAVGRRRGGRHEILTFSVRERHRFRARGHAPSNERGASGGGADGDADTHVEGFPPDDERFLPPHRGGCARASDEEEICLSFEPGTTDGRESPDGHPSQQHSVDPGANKHRISLTTPPPCSRPSPRAG